jgi:nuclear GTP-binding protein
MHAGRWRSNDYFGVADLISLLNKYAGGTAIVAGVFGPPNSGKSSVINSLARRPAAGVAATPGFTKAMQQIEVTDRISILDCPGVVPASGGEITPSMVLRNSIKVELLEDPIAPVAYILERVPKEQLVEAYEIGTFADADDFLNQLARKRGRLGKGGEPDLEAVARSVLADWNKGRIRYFTVPPPADETIEGPAELVTAWGEVYPMTRTLDFAENEFREFQIQHVFEVVNKKKQRVEAETDADAEDEDEEKVVAGPALPAAEQEELNQLAEEYMAISFENL